MAEQPQSKIIDNLLDQLQNSTETHVRRSAANLLGDLAIDNEQVLGALRNTAQSDTKESVRDAARISLQKLSGTAQQQNRTWSKIFLYIIGILLCLVAILLRALAE